MDRSDHPLDSLTLQLVPGASIDSCERPVRDCTAAYNRHNKMLDDVPRLLDVVRAAGFEDCRRDHFSSDSLPELREQTSEIERRALLGAFKIVTQRDSGLGWTVAEVGELGERCRKDLSKGEIYYRLDMHVVVGRRPF